MKVGFISDLHIDNFKYSIDEYLEVLTQVSQDNLLDCLVIGGDISNSYKTTTSFVEKLQVLAKIPIYFIPGNHDLWDRESDKEAIDTMKIYNLYKNHPQCLIESPLMLTEEVGLIGHPAWYNYVNYNTNKFSLEQIERGKYKGVTWQDKRYIQWPKGDREMSLEFSKLIEKDIQSLQASEYILVTHIITIPEFTMPLPHRVFDFFNAYIATDDLTPIYEKYPIRASVMGHVHFRGKVERDNTLFLTNSLGYVKEWRSSDMYHEMNDALVTLLL